MRERLHNKGDCKSFYTYVRSKTKVKTTVGPLTDENDIMVSGDEELGIQNMFFFASVFTKEHCNNLLAVSEIFHGKESEKLTSFNATSNMVKSKLNKLKMNKAPGIDSVGSEISENVVELYNTSLSTGDVPADWKLANVTPVFKKARNVVHRIIDRLV